MRDRLTGATQAVIRLFIGLNIGLGVLFALALLLSFPFEARLAAQLVAKYGAVVDAGGVIGVLRVLAIVGMVSVWVVHQVLAPLKAIVATIGEDPFVLANADRLTRIGWGLLGIQFVNLAAGGFTGWLRGYGVETATWTPQLAGWLGVLLAFVLARVFRRGAQMRDELAMTV